MKVSDKINAAAKEDRIWWSFEYFPPKTAQGVQNLYDRMERMYMLGPEFIDVTWNAGGRSSDLTAEIVSTAQSAYGLETVMHLTCTNMPRAKVDEALKNAKKSGCQSILALRGDPPRGQSEWEACEGGFEHAIDLVKYIREQYGDYFDIGVAGFPEGHSPEKHTRAQENQWLKEKVDAGATFIITQMFYDVDVFLEWLNEIRDIGVTVPVIPGIMLIQNWGGFQRTTSLSNTIIPKHFYETLEPIKDDDAAVREAGTKLVADMCRRMIAKGVTGLHFYTMNLEKACRMILEELNLIPQIENVKTLPWRPSLTPTRKEENVRPIFWKYRMRSYLSRTEGWDEFPNGRWGDSRSPAFGELDGYGISLKYTKEDAIKMWGEPQTLKDICHIFSSFCRGELKALPWSDQPVMAETDIIQHQLAKINELGFLTINSQPAVSGAKSTDKVHGWGPKDGYCYQKAYLEFFVSPENLDILIKKIEQTPVITYYAVNKSGDLRTNVQSDSPNAVTWGVFPGKEIIQPTIVDPVSFMAWKDEAFELGAEWARVYPKNLVSYKLITDIVDNWYLINIVHNDFHSKDAIFEIFEDFKEAENDNIEPAR